MFGKRGSLVQQRAYCSRLIPGPHPCGCVSRNNISIIAGTQHHRRQQDRTIKAVATFPFQNLKSRCHAELSPNRHRFTDARLRRRRDYGWKFIRCFKRLILNVATNESSNGLHIINFAVGEQRFPYRCTNELWHAIFILWHQEEFASSRKH